jgi:hypothetical protein
MYGLPFRRKMRAQAPAIGHPSAASPARRRWGPLTASHPALVAEWHPDRNGGLLPAGLSAGSRQRVWWRCALGHEWIALALSRALHGEGCPYCGGVLPTAATSLAATHPEVAAAWHPTRNGALDPAAVSAQSSRRVWWRCRCGHQWRLTVERQVAEPGCPRCSAVSGAPRRRWGRLSDTHPGLAAEWHRERNGPLRAAEVSAGSDRRVWWRCAAGHEWRAPVSSRALRGAGCPACALLACGRPPCG